MKPAADVRLAFAVTALLGALIVAELVVGGRRSTTLALPSPTAPKGPAAVPQVAPAKAADVILRRPMFQPDRRMQGGGATAAADGDSLPRLTGIAVTPDRTLAIFQAPGEKPRVAREGDSIGGWTIQKIERRQIVIQKSGGTMTLVPSRNPNGRTAPSTLQPPAHPAVQP